MIENDEELARALLAAGAESIHEIVHMEGSLSGTGGHAEPQAGPR